MDPNATPYTLYVHQEQNNSDISDIYKDKSIKSTSTAYIKCNSFLKVNLARRQRVLLQFMVSFFLPECGCANYLASDMLDAQQEKKPVC